MKEFASPKAFAAHLVKLAAIGQEVMHLAADKCGQVVENSAKAEIGFYQPQRGPFEAWQELADSTEQAKARKGQPTGAPLYAEGDMQKSIKHTTTGGTVVVGSTDPNMVYHEFGTDRIPPRPVLGPALFMNRDKIILGVGKMVANWVAGLGWRGVSIMQNHKRDL